MMGMPSTTKNRELTTIIGGAIIVIGIEGVAAISYRAVKCCTKPRV